MSNKPIERYTIDEVVELVQDIGFGQRAQNFRDNAVNGKDLLILSNEDFQELGLTKIQIKKLKDAISSRTGSGGQLPCASQEAQNQQQNDFGIPPPMPLQPAPAYPNTYAGPYATSAPAGYPGAGYTPQPPVPNLGPPPPSYGGGAGMPPTVYYAPPNFQSNYQQQQQAYNGPVPGITQPQHAQQGCACSIQ